MIFDGCRTRDRQAKNQLKAVLKIYNLVSIFACHQGVDLDEERMILNYLFEAYNKDENKDDEGRIILPLETDDDTPPNYDF